MERFRLGMRWWLALAFALIAAVTAVAVAEVFTARSETAFRERAEDLAVGNTFGAAEAVAEALSSGGQLEPDDVEAIAERRRLSLFVFDARGALISERRSRGKRVESIELEPGLSAALTGSRFVLPEADGRATLVALPLPAIGGAVLTYSSRPELVAQLGIVRDKIVEAALLAVLVGALAGLLIAALIATRLRRIAAAAAAIEAGSFDTALRPRFRDEVGDLALSIDRMRLRLRESFVTLESERDRLGRLLERLHDGVVTLDRGLEVQFSNAAARALFDPGLLREGERLPDPWPRLSLRDLAAGLFRAEAATVQEIVSVDRERTYSVVGIPAGPDADVAVLVLTDISERERRERAEREFVTNAAHELRTPLTTITGAIDLLQAGAKEDPAERDRFLRHIQRESARLARLTRALLVLARVQTKEEVPLLSAIELRPLLESVAADLQAPEDVRVEVRCPAGLAVLGEPNLVEQALANLAANAANHTQEGTIELSAKRSGESVTISVTDTGGGIPSEVQDRIFDRFFRADGRDARGFGLGLAIVRQAVEALDGDVAVESTPGAGTTIRVRLPLADEKVAA